MGPPGWSVNGTGVWKAPATGNADRKRLLGLLIEDVTLTRQGYRARIELRLRGGKCWSLGHVDLPKPRSKVVRRHASDAVLLELRAMLREGTNDKTAAAQLNRRGHRDSRGDAFTRRTVYSIRKRLGWRSGLEHRRERLRERGYADAPELAAQLGVCASHGRVAVAESTPARWRQANDTLLCTEWKPQTKATRETDRHRTAKTAERLPCYHDTSRMHYETQEFVLARYGRQARGMAP